MGGTGDYAFALANVLMGVRQHSPKAFDDIYIYHQGMEISDQDKLRSILDCQFLDYGFEANIDGEFARERHGIFSNLTYSRYECFSYLDRYKKVFWLDADLIIYGDISSMVHGFENSDVALSEDTIWLRTGANTQGNFSQPIPGYDMSARPYNAGVLGLCDSIKDPLAIKSWCYTKTREIQPLLTCADQGVIALALQHFKLKVQELDHSRFNTFVWEDVSKSAIVHMAISNLKAWNNYWVHQSFPLWSERHKAWIAMGGREAEAFLALKRKHATPLGEPIFNGESRYANLLLAEEIGKGGAQTNLSSLERRLEALEYSVSLKGIALRLLRKLGLRGRG